MEIGGLQKFSVVEYPGKLSCIIFTLGCNFRCPYCHNPELVNKTATRIPEEHIFEFLEKRKGLLDGVMITGGEPTLQLDLPEFCRKIKERGFLVGLETNGTNPQVLQELLDEKLLNFMAMDVKAPLEKYSEIVKMKVDTQKIKKSIELIMKSNLGYEFRTTCYPVLTKKDFQEIFQLIKGAKKYALQQFSPQNTLVPINLKPKSRDFLYQLIKIAEDYFKEVDLRI